MCFIWDTEEMNLIGSGSMKGLNRLLVSERVSKGMSQSKPMKQQVKKFAVVAFLGCSALALGARADGSPVDLNLNLKQTLQYALEHSPLLNTALRNRTIRDLEVRSAWSKILPSFDVTGSGGLQDGSPSTVPNPWYSNLNLALTENLYDNGSSWNAFRVAELNQKLSEIEYNKTRDTLILEVVSSYYRLSLSHVLSEIRRGQSQALEKQFKLVTDQYEQGLKPKNDFLRIKTQVQRANIEQLTAANAILAAEAELRKLLGVGSGSGASSPSVEFKPIPVQRKRAPSEMEQLFAKLEPGLEKTYEFRSAEISKQVNERAVTLVERAYWPQVNLSAGLSYSNQNYWAFGVKGGSATTGAVLPVTGAASPADQWSWNALLSVQYNLWDWGTRRRAVQIAEENREIQSNSIVQNLLDIQFRLTQLRLDMGRILKNYKLTLDLLELEEESNRNLEIQYREGKVFYIDYITGLNSLLDAKVQFFTSYFDSYQTAAQARFYSGKISEVIDEN